MEKLVIIALFCNFNSDKQRITKQTPMITEDKVTEIFCVIDEFCKNFDAENGQKSFERVSLARWKMPQKPQRAVGCK